MNYVPGQMIEAGTSALGNAFVNWACASEEITRQDAIGQEAYFNATGVRHKEVVNNERTRRAELTGMLAMLGEIADAGGYSAEQFAQWVIAGMFPND